MTMVLTPHSANQSASRCRSAVKVPKLRTGSDARSAPTAATCMVAPISMAAAFGLTTASPECVACDFALRFISILLLTKAEGLGCAVDQFPKRDRATTHGPCFFTGSLATKKWTAAPFRSQDRAQQFLSPQAAAFRDGFLGGSKYLSRLSR